ncbi:MAG: tripartite tricarboxylate transporter substrate binding protein [Pseudomonadota bacterium]
MSSNRMLSSRAKCRAAIVCAFAACILPFAPAYGQEFPSRNIRLIVNVAAGGVTDALARLVGHGLNEKWGKPVVVENLVGGNSSIAAKAVASAKADGHTLLVTADAPFTATPFLAKNLNFSLSEFTPLAVICRPIPVFAVKASLGVKTLKEFIALAKARPGALGFSSQGVGTYGHLGMEDFKRRAGIDMLHVPYRGGAPALEGLLRGDVAALITNYSTVAPYERSGDVIIVAAAGDRRSNARPDIPTASEDGVPGFSVSTWFGIFGPAGMSPDLIAKIRDGVETALESDRASEYFKANSCERMMLTPQQFNEMIATDYRHWGDLIKTIGIEIE